MVNSTNSKTIKNFDLLFVGFGAANCLLILSLHNNDLLKGKSIAILEPDSKTRNDRTFCFWATEEELAKLNLKSLVSYSWDNIQFNGIDKQQIEPLRYYHVKGLDLYNETKKILCNHHVTYFNSVLKEKPRVESNFYVVNLENDSIIAHKVYDSRPPVFLEETKNQSHIYQSFFGWTIKTSAKVFDESTITMMDFNIPQNNYTQFVYILPFDKNTALIEVTRFGEGKLFESEANLILEDYIKKIALSYDILEVEQGVIPMSSFNIQIDDFGENWINMGARANMLKSTTGYAFHSMAEDALVQMHLFRSNQFTERKKKKQRFGFYDRLFLKILKDKPEFGKLIFETLFKKVEIKKVLSFLREKTTILEEISIFAKLPKRIFIKTAMQDFLVSFAKFPVVLFPFLLTILFLFFSKNNLEYISWTFLVFGFLFIGLTHGALDHIASRVMLKRKQVLFFVFNYLIKSLLFGLVWVLNPDFALFLFIAYTAWHFGQADFKEWNLRQGWKSFIWGFILLFLILFLHFKELNDILEQIPNLQITSLLDKISKNNIFLVQVLLTIFGVLLAVLTKSKFLFITIVYLLISSMLPLLVSFGIYFVGQHSINGWKHLCHGLNENFNSLWLKSLPFSIAGALIICWFLLVADSNFEGLFFIILACISIPHIASMHHFYSKIKK
jgi:lycopene beta-cyclase